MVHRDTAGYFDDRKRADEAWILRHADAVYHFFDPKAVERLRAELGFTCPAASVLPACVDELLPRRELPRLSAGGELHVAYTAGLPVPGTDLPGYLQQLPGRFARLLEGGLHVHVYARSLEGLHPAFRPLLTDPLFHVEPPVPYDELLDQLTAYDWGYYDFDLERMPIRPGFERFASSGFFTFLDAGIPVLTSPTTPTYAELVERFGAGIVASGECWDSIPSRLREATEPARAGARRARGELRPDGERLWEIVFGESAG